MTPSLFSKSSGNTVSPKNKVLTGVISVKKLCSTAAQLEAEQCIIFIWSPLVGCAYAVEMSMDLGLDMGTYMVSVLLVPFNKAKRIHS